MNLTLTGARSLVAIVAIAGVTGTAATTASASTHTPQKSQAKHAKRLPKKTASRPDLVAGALTVDATDSGFDVTASVTNQGRGFAKSSDVVIALSDDATLDDNDEVLDEYNVSSVSPGVTRSFDDQVDLPDDIASNSEYLIVCVDGNQELAESNESNNCVSEQVDTSASAANSAVDDGSSDDSTDPSDDSSDSPIVLTGGQS